MTTSIETTMPSRGPLPFITVEEAIAFGQMRVQEDILAKEAAKELAVKMELPLRPKDDQQAGAMLSLFAEDHKNGMFDFTHMFAEYGKQEEDRSSENREGNGQEKKKDVKKDNRPRTGTAKEDKTIHPLKAAGQEKIFSNDIGDLVERSQNAAITENMANMASYITLTTGRDAQFDIGKDKLQLKIGLDDTGNKQVYAYVNDKKVTRDEALGALAKLPPAQAKGMEKMIVNFAKTDTVKQMQAMYGYNQSKMQAIAKTEQAKNGKIAGMQI